MTAVTMSPDVVADLLARVGETYGLTLQQDMLIEGEVDFSIGAVANTGLRYLIKGRESSVDSPDLIWQERVHERLGEREFPFDVPRLVRSLSGEGRVVLEVGGVPHAVRVLTFVSGELMSSLSSAPTPEFFTDLGRVSALLTEALGDLTPPVDLSDHFWVLSRSRRALEESLSQMPPDNQVARVREIAEFFDEVVPSIVGLPTATVHQDLNTHNVLVDPAHPVRVTGVIDFNDTVRTFRAADVAIAAGYAMIGSADPVASFLAVVRGYESVTTLEPEERAVLFPFGAIRLCVNWSTWLVRSGGDPASYAATRMQATWPTLQLLTDLGLRRVQERILSSLGD